MLDPEFDEAPPPRRRRSTDLTEIEGALTADQVMQARGYIRDPETGTWG